MIDLSDGLAADGGHLGRASGWSCGSPSGRFPWPRASASWHGSSPLPTWELAAGGGEDYELCFCAPPKPVQRSRTP